MLPKDADGMTNSVGPDQTAPLRSSLIWICTVYTDLSVPILRIFMVIMSIQKKVYMACFIFEAKKIYAIFQVLMDPVTISHNNVTFL